MIEAAGGQIAAQISASAGVYTLILPILLLVPKRLIDTADGQMPEVALTAD